MLWSKKVENYCWGNLLPGWWWEQTFKGRGGSNFGHFIHPWPTVSTSQVQQLFQVTWLCRSILFRVILYTPACWRKMLGSTIQLLIIFIYPSPSPDFKIWGNIDRGPKIIKPISSYITMSLGSTKVGTPNFTPAATGKVTTQNNLIELFHPRPVRFVCFKNALFLLISVAFMCKLLLPCRCLFTPIHDETLSNCSAAATPRFRRIYDFPGRLQ